MFTYHGVTFKADEIIKYSRKSRSDDPLLSVDEVLEKHEKILNEWCERNLGEMIPECNSFREIVSGETIEARPEFQTILRLIENPNKKAILTVEVQRLSRGDLEDAGRIMKLLRYTNTFVITPDMVFDLNDEYDRDRFKRELDRGNDYLEYYKKINWRGRLESVKSGYFIGSVAPYGYDRTTIMDGRKKRYTLKINEREAEAVRLMFDLYVNHNFGYIRIANQLDKLGYTTRSGNLWSDGCIKDVLCNIHYIGKIKWNWRKTVNTVVDGEISKSRPRNDDAYSFDGKHPAIISDELFERAQTKMGNNPRVKSRAKLINPLAGLLYCNCGRVMLYSEYRDKNGKEKCSPRLICKNTHICRTPSITYHEVINKVAEALKSCITEFEIKIKNDSENTLINHNNQIKRLENKLEELNKKELSQWEKYSEESMPKAIFDKLNEKVLQEKEMVTKTLQEMRQAVPKVEDYQDAIMRFTDALDALNNPNVSVETKNRLLKACIEKIIYTRESGGDRWRPKDYELDIKLKIFPN